MKDISIIVENVSKIYKIYDKPIQRLKESLTPYSKKKYFREHFALDNINISINKGDTIGIIGKNGSGKSTLLKLITGVLNPTTGKIYTNGKIAALLELGAGFNPEYTGIENIFLNGLMMGFSKEEMNDKLEDIVKFADIGEFIYQPVKTYSSGMFARLAFSVAINVEPNILIVDEALSVGDMYFQAKCITKMKEMFSSGITVLFVTHDTNAIKTLCEKTLLLDHGRMIAFGPSEEVVDLYAKKIREEMTILNNKLIKEDGTIEKSFSLDNLTETRKICFKENEDFRRRIAYYRQGTQDVVLTDIEILNNKNEKIEIVKFNEEIKIKMYIKYSKDCTVCVGYHIRDNKNIEILGSNTLIENIGELKGKQGDRIIVEFKTKVPLIEGLYNLSTVISTATIHNRAAVFVDYTENACFFNVAENEEYKIWNKVYIKNNIEIYKV